MPSPCFVYRPGGNRLTSVAIIGANLLAYSSAHALIDKKQALDIHLFTEKAELGLMSEGPGIFERWPPCPETWISHMGPQEPGESDTAVRRSWFEKSLATRLSTRGCTIHLKTRVTSVSGGVIHFVGAGPLGTDRMSFEKILDLRVLGKDKPIWQGAVSREEDSVEGHASGKRPDGTIELWWNGKRPSGRKWLQTMEWHGLNPVTSLKENIENGLSEAVKLVDTIIQNPLGQ